MNDLTHGPIAYIGARHLIIEELEDDASTCYFPQLS